jgi:hypothetical protein
MYCCFPSSVVTGFLAFFARRGLKTVERRPEEYADSAASWASLPQKWASVGVQR